MFDGRLRQRAGFERLFVANAFSGSCRKLQGQFIFFLDFWDSSSFSLIFISMAISRNQVWHDLFLSRRCVAAKCVTYKRVFSISSSAFWESRTRSSLFFIIYKIIFIFHYFISPWFFAPSPSEKLGTSILLD
jgi:hypothetical protein